MSQEGSMTNAWNNRPVYARVTIIGLVLMAMPAIMIAIVQSAQGNAVGSLIFAFIIFVIPLAAAVLIWRYGRWALIVAMVVGVLDLVNLIRFLEYGVGRPNSFFDFVPSLLILVGSLITLLGGATAYIQAGRGEPRTAITGVELSASLGIAIALVVLVVMSVIVTATQRSTVSAEDRARSLSIALKDFQFRPDRITIPAGVSIQTVIENRDILGHTFTIKDLDIDHTLGPDSQILIKLGALEPGEYTLTCEVPGHESMEGVLVVK